MSITESALRYNIKNARTEKRRIDAENLLARHLNIDQELDQWCQERNTKYAQKQQARKAKRAQKKRERKANVLLSVQEEEKQSRYIPKSVQREVHRRDQGKCVECDSKVKLEFDHILPFSKGGSNTARNIQLLCEYCNRSKGATI